jgi:hypothetical protein
MFPRADFATLGTADETLARIIQELPLQQLESNGIYRHYLRKPDFQRETNHWTPEQVASLIQCFVDGELIPAVILWRSSTHTFIIDGGHRMSALRAWVEDDYGDRNISKDYFGAELKADDIKAAKATRELVENTVGTWQTLKATLTNTNASDRERKRLKIASERGIEIQWLQGDPDKAEESFFKINSQGTPLDEIEEDLLKNRRIPIAVAARAIVRAGEGHKYWSGFDAENQASIKAYAKDLHETLFRPELVSPTRSLNLPIAGSSSVRAALQLLTKFLFLVDNPAVPKERDDRRKSAVISWSDYEKDFDGSTTVRVLKTAADLVNRVCGNSPNSLGLHPAIYFYGNTGKHVVPLFMGFVTLLKRKEEDNDRQFFRNFSTHRQKIEEALITYKPLIVMIQQKTADSRRIEICTNLFTAIINRISRNEMIDDGVLIADAGLTGKVLAASFRTNSSKFSKDTKSSIFLSSALISAVKCGICGGYIDNDKNSFTYDHIERAKEGGRGLATNGQLAHPYCNSGLKG